MKLSIFVVIEMLNYKTVVMRSHPNLTSRFICAKALHEVGTRHISLHNASDKAA